MKYQLILLTLLLLFVQCIFAEVDTLAIKLKNGQTDKIAISQIQSIKFENITAITDELEIASNLVLQGNYPNPTNDFTNLEFNLSSPGFVDLFIYNPAGRLIQMVKNLNCNQGENIFKWDCRDMYGVKVSSGTYYYEIRFMTEIHTHKMLIIK